MNESDRILEIASRRVPNTMRLTRHSKLDASLGWDHLDMIEFVMEVEYELGVTITNDEICLLDTIGDIIDMVMSKRNIP